MLHLQFSDNKINEVANLHVIFGLPENCLLHVVHAQFISIHPGGKDCNGYIVFPFPLHRDSPTSVS